MPQDALINSNSKIKKWRLYDEEIPTICLDLGVHLHNLAYFILEKEPKKVMANFFNSSRHKKIIDNVKNEKIKKSLLELSKVFKEK